MQVSLYSQDTDEQRLLHYLRTARGTLGSPLYDAQFALQVARQHGKLNACVQLLCELNLHEVTASFHSHHCYPPASVTMVSPELLLSASVKNS